MDLTLKVGADIANFNAQLQKMNSSLGSVSNSVRGLASSFGIAFGASTVFMGVKSAIQTMANFEKQVDTVAAITGATGKDFENLRKNALELGRATEYTASEVAGLQIEYGRLGFTSKEILNATEATINLATATGEDLAKAADVAGSTLRGFQLDASESVRVVDVMASSFNKSALSLENFRESMKYVAPVAKATNASVEETTALLGVLADAGIRGSQAGTSLRRIFSELAKDGRPLIERLQELSDKGLTLAGAQDEVGAYAKTALLVLTSQTDKVRNLTYAFNNAAGEGQRVANIMRDNLTGDVNKLKSAFEGLVLSGSGVTGMLRDMTQNLTTFISGITAGEGTMSFFSGWLKMIMTVPRYALKGLAALVEGFDKVSKAIDNYLEKQKKIRDEALRLEQTVLFSDLQSGILGAEGTKKAQKRLIEIGKLLGEVRNNLEDALPDLNGKNGDAGDGPLSLLASLEKKLSELRDKQNAAFDASSVMSYGRQIEDLSQKIAALKSGIPQDPIDSLTRKNTTEQIYKTPKITDSLIPSMDEVNKRLAAQIVPITTLRGEIDFLMESYKALGRVMEVDLQPVLEGIAVSFGEAIGAMLTGAHGIEAIGSVLLGGIGDIATALGRAMIEFGVAAVALKALIKNPATAIAAGVALVALGAALKSKASSIVSGGGAGGGASSGTGRDRNPLTRIEYLGERINLTGEFKVKGQDLVAVITNQNRRDSRLTNKNG